MTKLQQVIRYICQNYPHSHELSNARLTKMVYLADWESARRRSEQITDIQWYFNNYGPFVDDVQEAAKLDPKVEVVHTTTMYGTPKVQMIYIGESKDAVGLSAEEADLVDHVINETKSLYWNSFIKYVYDTYPVRSNPRYSHLDLVELAKKESVELLAT